MTKLIFMFLDQRDINVKNSYMLLSFFCFCNFSNATFNQIVQENAYHEVYELCILQNLNLVYYCSFLAKKLSFPACCVCTSSVVLITHP